MSSSDQLRSLARQAHQYQSERGLSDAALCRKISQLGSTKTYKRILDEHDELQDLNLERQIANYQSAVAYIDTLRSEERPPEPEYPTFSNIVESLGAVARALTETSIARFVVIEGENGTGKDAVKNAILKQYPKMAIPVEATELWRDAKEPRRAISDALSDILKSVKPIRRDEQEKGELKIPIGVSAKLQLLEEELMGRKIILIINEGHHSGPNTLNILKTLINKTPTVIVLECIPRLLARLVNANYEEAIQLFGNRLCQRVVLPSPPQDEILELFEKRGLKFHDEKTANTAAAMLAGEAPQFGNWRYVTDVSRECRPHADNITLDKFTTALSRARDRRIKQQKS